MKKNIIKKASSYFIIVFLIFSVAFAATSCEKNENGSSQKEDAVSTSLPTGPVTLNIYHWTAESNITPIINEFEKQYPNVKVIYHKMATSDHAESNVVLASGQPVDAMAQGTIDDTRMRATNNVFTDLNPYMKADGMDMTKNFGKDVAGLETFDGKVYALPYCRNVEALFYNTEMFKKAGISIPTDDWTWDDLRAAAIKLSSGSGANRIYGFLPNYQDNAGTDWVFLAQELLGADYIYKDKGKESNFDDPAFLQSLTYFYDMEMKDKSAWPISEYAALKIDSNPFIQFYMGKTAMMIAPEYAIKYSADKAYNFAGFDYGVANLPKVKASDDMKNLYYVTDYGIPASSKNKEYAWKFIKMFCVDRPDLSAGAKGQLPGPEYSTLTPELQTAINKAVFGFPHFDQESGKRVFITNKPQFISKNTNTTIASTEITNFEKNEIYNCLQGNETPEQALKNIKTNADRLIKQAQ